MNSFRNAYKNAAGSLPVPDIRLEDVLERAGNRRTIHYKTCRRLSLAVTAACLFLLCGVGTVTAVNYYKSVIRVNENGFQTADKVTDQRNRDSEASALDIQGGAAIAEDGGTQEAYAAGGNGKEDAASDEKKLQFETIERMDYSTLADMREAQPDLALAMPELALVGGDDAEQSYTVMGSTVYVRFLWGDKYFRINQHDFSDSVGHGTTTVYSGGVSNERTYTTGQGFTYTVIDSEAGEGGLAGIHAAISLKDYELIVDFDGYTEEEAFYILETMDLNIYL